ncbi:MAG: D-alanyl-D-alanine carboxypeptidase [Candidatus Parcubacteria bacterium]|nr:D-alanyl-D-alanine carboxypeptidase [Candidatus Parcubacteria bacterium]
MQRFFNLVFGGLTAVFVGVGIGWGCGKLLRSSEVAAFFVPQTADGTLVAGLLRTIRYTADQEENGPTPSPSPDTQIFPAKSSGHISATAYMVKDITSDTVVAQSNQDLLVPIASLTKLVTAVVARRVIPDDTRITISPDVMDIYGNTAGFHVGETFNASDLMYPLLMVSSNDAAEAFAHQYGRTRFIRAMNDFAQSIGAYRTYFADASGLSPQNKSTASDVARILGWIYLHDPTVLGITELKAKTIRAHTWVNPAHFLSLSYYLGGKNGFTDEAANTTASLFTAGPHKDVYAIVVLGSRNRDVDVTELLKKIK